METPETGGDQLRPPETGGDQWRLQRLGETMQLRPPRLGETSGDSRDWERPVKTPETGGDQLRPPETGGDPP